MAKLADQPHAAALNHQPRAELRKAVTMLQPLENNAPKPQYPSNPNHAPVKTISTPVEQATIGRSLFIKGEVSGSESLYIDGRIEGSIDLADNRVTIGRSGSVAANITAREVVIMGKVQGNVQCADRLDIRSEGALTGDVVTQRISIEDGALVKGSVQVRAAEHKNGKAHGHAQAKPTTSESAKPTAAEQPKAAAAGA
jgi:cytoskeletal protein CcmA (bactofilin family)